MKYFCRHYFSYVGLLFGVSACTFSVFIPFGAHELHFKP